MTVSLRGEETVRAELVEALPFRFARRGPEGRSTGSGRTVRGAFSQLHPLADARLHVDDCVLRPAADLFGNLLRPEAASGAVGEDDGADHGDEEHQPGAFEDVEVARVED